MDAFTFLTLSSALLLLLLIFLFVLLVIASLACGSVSTAKVPNRLDSMRGVGLSMESLTWDWQGRVMHSLGHSWKRLSMVKRNWLMKVHLISRALRICLFCSTKDTRAVIAEHGMLFSPKNIQQSPAKNWSC